MDLIRISDSKLKIMLTSSDMLHYDLHNDTASITDASVRKALRRVLSDAKQQTGFDGDLSHLYVQMYPGADGGCELFVCKAEDEGEEKHTLPAMYPNAQSRALRAPDRLTRETYVYSFVRLADVIALCKRLSCICFSGKSSLYVDCKRIYHLFLYDLPRPSLYSPDEYCFLNEYGVRENVRSVQTRIDEYGMLLRENDAVEVFSQL